MQQESNRAALERGVLAIETKIAGLDKQLKDDVIRARTKEAAESVRNYVIAMNKCSHAVNSRGRNDRPAGAAAS
jgi:hypothetical protein